MLVKIKNHPKYLINESGNIIDLEGNLIRTFVDQFGLISAFIDGQNYYVHELVANTFLVNNNNCKFVNHINDDLLNNHISNLYYSDKTEIKESPINTSGYRKGYNDYEIFNEETGDVIFCQGREMVADTIQYSLISLKNMVGNGRKIALGPYKGYQIRRLTGRTR